MLPLGSTQLSDFEKKLEQETASTLFQLLYGFVLSAKHHLWTEAAIRRATAEYATHYRERFGEVKVLGMTRAIPLHKIYTAVRMVAPQFLRAFTDVDDMEKTFKSTGRNAWKPFQSPRPARHWNDTSAYKDRNDNAEFGEDDIQATKDGIEVANRERFLNILGAPGSGKSTFLRRLGQEAMLAPFASRNDSSISTRYLHQKLPVLIELRRFRQEPIDIVGAIQRELVTCGFPEAPQFVDGLLNQGRLLVLLDGLDEVPNNRLDEVIFVVKAFLDQYGGPRTDGNRFVMSCRTAHYRNFIPKFTDVVLADFSDDQIAQFVGNWFHSLTDRQDTTAKRLLDRLREPQHEQARELAQTPLLLTFLCMTFQDRQELPPTQATLYRAALEILLHKWAAERRVHNEQVYAELTAELEVDMLAEMAAELFAEDRFFFSRQQATDHIAKFMKKELNGPKSLDSDQILTCIEVQQGLIVRRAHDAYSFSHLTIQEYLTARELWTAGPQTWRVVVQDCLLNERWAVVFVLMAGLGKADDLLLHMSQQCLQIWTRMVHHNEWIDSVVQWQISSFLSKDGTGERTSQLTAAFRVLSLALFLAVELFHLRHMDAELSLSLSDALSIVRDLSRGHECTSALVRDSHRDLAGTLSGDRARDIVSIICNSGLLAPRASGRLLEWLEVFPKLAVTQAMEDLRVIIGLPQPMREGRTSIKELTGAWKLIIRCKNAAYRTTSGTWDEVCTRLLSLPGK